MALRGGRGYLDREENICWAVCAGRIGIAHTHVCRRNRSEAHYEAQCMLVI